ncbi:ABC transporter substrate-binding protein [Haloarcula sp. S1CR25-12]|uniref:ABC transporter substrate-binding protein n=1 Tax=Haloarcula saliterrae TaxID=2950534 RepID=A0ABU2FG24_9EURY|nr:ABC transporter substrate-binding protein [Haloarcula sp. S1CR25-12]MDS0261209.1 ABC transporter substrate-binding protein [Haloarcula sp. S1CR25-12]
MSNDTDRRQDGLTRRDTLKYGATAAASLGLAGCSDLAGQSGGDGTPTGTGPYTVSMPPMGEVEFDGVPETYMSYRVTHADIGVALGVGDRLQAVYKTSQYPFEFYDELPGVDVDGESLAEIEVNSDYEADKEWFYEMDCDVHLMDPEYMSQWLLTPEDVDELSEKVGPFFGHYARRRVGEQRDYPFLSLYEIFEKVSRVFQREERFEAFSAFHDEFIGGLRAELPPESERPEVGLVATGPEMVENGEFGAYHIDPGYGKKQYIDLEVRNGMEGAVSNDTSYATVDYETLLDYDPDVLVIHNGIFTTESREEFVEQVIEPMADDPLGSRLTAVQNDDVYRGGNNSQGPVTNLFQTESLAKQLYPDLFGEFTGFGQIPESEQLFDRGRVADIINGDSQ